MAKFTDSAAVVPEGLSFSADFMTPEFEAEIIAWLDEGVAEPVRSPTARAWEPVNPSNPSSRRVQHFGYNYTYSSRSVTPGPPMEGPILQLAQQLEAAGLMRPVQCIVNEYFQTQGISAHSDSKNFGPVVIGISISADAVMTFRRGSDRFNLFLPRRSIMMMTGEARYSWTHEISGNKTYTVDGQKFTKSPDYRRLSLTFRELA